MEKKNKKNSRILTSSALPLCRGAIIAAMYVALTSLAAVMGLASGAIQFRISEMLCILPMFIPEAIPGLFIGCLISNLIAGGVVWDVIFGSVATLIGAVGAYALRNVGFKWKWLGTLPTILANSIIVPLILMYAYGLPDGFFVLAGGVAVGEIVCAGVLGTFLYYALHKVNFPSMKKIRKVSDVDKTEKISKQN